MTLALLLAAAFSVETRARYLMGTICEITAPVSQIDAAFAEAARIERFLSTWKEDSELSRLNRDGNGAVSPELYALLASAMQHAKQTGGAFNPLVAPLIEAWNTREEGAWPAPEALIAARAKTDLSVVSFSDGRIALNGARFEEGAFGKGYAIDRMLARLAGDAVVNFGGQLGVRGAHRVTIADPSNRDRAAIELTLQDASLSTSAGSEKTFEVAGRRFTHIIDPRSGDALPPRGSVSVVAKDAFSADVLSTALYVMGSEEGLRWADAHGVAVLFISPDNQILRSKAFPAIAILDRKFKAKDCFMFRRFLLVLVPTFFASALAAQGPTDLEQRLRALENKIQQIERTAGAPDLSEIRREIDVLSREIEALKTRQTEKVAQADAEQFGLGAAASKVYRADHGMSFGGYGEMLYQNLAGTTDGGVRASTRDNADMLRAVLYAGYKFNDRVIFNSETEFEHGTTGAGGEVSVEFAYLDFLARENFGIRGGLVLVPLGFINEQHEPTAFLGARRPLVERTIIPATWREMGVGAFGENGPFSWRAYLTTGLNAARFTGAGGLRSGRGNGAQSLAEDFALSGRLDFAPMVGTTIGAAVYAGNSGQNALVSGQRLDARVTMWEAHAETKIRGLQARGLFSRGTLGDAAQVNRLNGLTGANSVGSTFGGWYGELAYDLASLRGFGERSLTPFVRYERLDTQIDVPAGFLRNRANNQTITTFGIQWKPISQAVIKTDYQNVNNEAGTATNQWNVAVGYIF